MTLDLQKIANDAAAAAVKAALDGQKNGNPSVAVAAVIEKGATVLVKEKHLHGIAGVVSVVVSEPNATHEGEFVIRLIDDAYQGALYQFLGSSLELVTDPDVLNLNNHDRLPWPETTE